MALYFVTVHTDDVVRAFDGFIEADSIKEALDKAETWVKEAPLHGQYAIRAVGQQANQQRSGKAP